MYCNFEIDMNNIGNEGCKYLSIAKWENLTDLYLGKLLLIKVKIKLDLKDASIWVLQNGRILVSFILVYLTFIKGKMSLELKDASLLVLLIGKISQNWIWVYHLSILDSNKIGNEGCKHLSIAKWPVLKKLHLSTLLG